MSRHGLEGLFRRCAFDLHKRCEEKGPWIDAASDALPERRRWSVNVVVRLRHMGGRVLRERLSRAEFPLMTASAMPGKSPR